MSDEALDLVARRSQLLMKKDEKRREHRSLQDRTVDARREYEQVEKELWDLEKEEIKALKKRQPPGYTASGLGVG